MLLQNVQRGAIVAPFSAYFELRALTISQNWPARENWFSVTEKLRKKASPRDPARGFYVDYARGQMKTIWRM